MANALLAYQREFFLRGPKAIVPLTLKDIAAEIGVHETTVSRLSNGKYIQTEWGIYELKYFFSSSVSGTDGGTHSKESVKQTIKEIVVEEGGHSLSDQRISELLEKRGIKIARRTVAKYRKELDIDSSYSR
jgi:RNA polymerase sigma-54 factor